jgi:hypothetical protein
MKDTRAVHGDRGMCDYSLCSICHRYSHTVPFGRYVPGLADSSLPSLRFSRLTCFPAYMLFPQGPNIAHPTVIPDDDSSRASYPSERAILPPAPAPPTRSPLLPHQQRTIRPLVPSPFYAFDRRSGFIEGEMAFRVVDVGLPYEFDVVIVRAS